MPATDRRLVAGTLCLIKLFTPVKRTVFPPSFDRLLVFASICILLFVRRTDMHQNDNYFLTWREFGKRSCLDFYGRDFEFSEFSDYTLALNFICAEIFKDVIEYSRASYPKRTGILCLCSSITR